ncbi:MAG: hypothetical protein HYU59_13130, partial [Magnetospirillum gryphiswaldense]|nr:hypothetical protein [Magnetospirillum gryphiswaldense]
MMTERKLFTAEIQRLKAQAVKGGQAAVAAIGGPSNDEVLRVLNEIRSDIRNLEHAMRGEEAPPPSA